MSDHNRIFLRLPPAVTCVDCVDNEPISLQLERITAVAIFRANQQVSIASPHLGQNSSHHQTFYELASRKNQIDRNLHLESSSSCTDGAALTYPRYRLLPKCWKIA
jgi:hypothetical protein